MDRYFTPILLNLEMYIKAMLIEHNSDLHSTFKGYHRMTAKARIFRRDGKVSLMQHDNYIHYSPVIFTQGKFPVESVEYSEANDPKKETEAKFFMPVLSTASRDHCS